MKCTCCGAEMVAHKTDLPFKIGDSRIVVIRELPVMECTNCPEYLLSDEAMRGVEKILAKTDKSSELRVIRYAA